MGSKSALSGLTQQQLTQAQQQLMQQAGAYQQGAGYLQGGQQGQGLATSSYSVSQVSVGLAGAFFRGDQGPVWKLEDGGTVFGEITAYRAWYVHYDSMTDRPYLRSITTAHPWIAGTPMRDDLTPNSSVVDGLGVFSFKRPTAAISLAAEGGVTRAWGSIKIWGTVIEHDLGYRSQFARVASIGGLCCHGLVQRFVSLGRLKELREIYGVSNAADDKAA